ncbi:RNA-dependent RNA polymerase [Fusarium poae mitovirus 1]|uniref:RNA-dependent RNA polymerase n=1 Tax=Fusarium poae mitovirus 1 TaxID=1848150 RepID=A0A1B4ZA49_9VIRU|nr:RNA-dependent RNA polymerase [Fusarium poae mitovirus 1]BAV56289.1 RNA-dependent RNA polymerase [Fusarium poae mitovirus 1]
MLRNQIKIIKRLCSIFFPRQFQPQHFVELYKLYNSLIKFHGYGGAIKYIKLMRLHCTRYICGNPLKTNSNGIGLTKDGWPIKLLFLKKSVDEGNFSYVLTLLMFNRSIDLPKHEVKKKMKKLSFNSITQPSTCKYTIPTGFIKEFVRINNLKISHANMELNPKDFYLSNKAGPQGKSVLTAHRNWVTFTDSFIQRLNKLAVGGYAVDWLRRSQKFWQDQIDNIKSSPYHAYQGKLSVVKDPEGKFRIIAIVDYYTQLFLKKLHLEQFRLIKNLDCDKTFTQDPTHHWDYSNKESFWSLDLSSATDRFPRILQFRLIGEMYNYDFAKVWNEHLGSLEFSTPDGEKIQYNAGQPMGTYSSWVSFTLAHHLVVHWCAKLEGVKDFDQYIILGDDIVIKHNKIAKRYIKIMEKLGVELSLAKTHVSEDTYEFAKRWFKNSIEVTGLPTRGIIHNFKSPNIVFTILYDFYKIKNNTYLSFNSLVDSMSRLYKNFYLLEKVRKNTYKKIFIRFNRKIYNNLLDFSTVLDFSFGYEDNQKLSELFNRKLYLSEQYTIPATMKSLRTIIGIGLKDKIVEQIKTLDNLKSHFNKMDFKTDNPMRGAFIKLHLVWPLYNGVRNEIQDLYKSYNSKIDKNNMSIYEYVSEVRIIDIQGIYEKQRQKYATLLTIGQTMNRGFSQVNQYMKSNENNPLMGPNLYFINILANAHFDMKWNSEKKKFNEGWNPASLIGNLT